MSFEILYDTGKFPLEDGRSQREREWDEFDRIITAAIFAQLKQRDETPESEWN